MAIDTRRKRQNAAQVGCPLPVSVLPSSIDAFARAQISWTYGGITINPPSLFSNEDRIFVGTIGSRVDTVDVHSGGMFQMAAHSLGQITVTTPGTRVRLTSLRNNPKDAFSCQSILVQVISSASHTNTGRVYLYDAETGGAPITLAVPTTNTIPSASITKPDAPGALNAADYWVDADNGTDGVNAWYVR